MNEGTSGVFIGQPGTGRTMRAFGEELTFHLGGAETAGKFTLWTEISPPGGGPPQHYHTGEDETFYVQEGRYAFFRDNTWQEVAPGGVVFVPRNVVHAFKNLGDTPGRMLVCTQPSGFEHFFARCVAEFEQPGGPNMDRILAISAEHGIHFVS